MVKEKERQKNREYSLTSVYLRDIANYDFLSAEKERELVLSTEKNPLYRRNELIEAHTWLVVKIARQYKKSNNAALDDLIQEGNIGLIHAADKFDARMDNRFSTYAIWWIRHHLQRYLDRNHSLIRLPYRKVKELRMSSQYEAVEQNKIHTQEDRAERMSTKDKDHLIPQVVQSKNEEFLPEIFSVNFDCAEKLLLLKEKMDIEKKLMDFLSDEEYRVIYERVFTGHKKVSVRLVAERLGMKETYARKLLHNACKKMKQKAVEWGLSE